MTYYKNKKNIVLSVFLIACLTACKKNTSELKSPEEYYISSKGAILPIENSSIRNYRIIIPENALLKNQYIKEKVTDPTKKLIFDSVFCFGAISDKSISFARYNCNDLTYNGTIKLTVLYHYWDLQKIQNAKPYCINNSKNINDFNNWEEINSFTIVTENGNNFYTFQFTDLTKTYFIGWASN